MLIAYWALSIIFRFFYFQVNIAYIRWSFHQLILGCFSFINHFWTPLILAFRRSHTIIWLSKWVYISFHRFLIYLRNILSNLALAQLFHSKRSILNASRWLLLQYLAILIYWLIMHTFCYIGFFVEIYWAEIRIFLSLGAQSNIIMQFFINDTLNFRSLWWHWSSFLSFFVWLIIWYHWFSSFLSDELSWCFLVLLICRVWPIFFTSNHYFPINLPMRANQICCIT